MARKNNFIENADKVIGEKIRELRISTGCSRDQIANKIGVTHQQLDKYERGTNRVSAGRLCLIAKAFNKTIAFFFEGIEEAHIALPSQHQRMCIEVSRNFMKIKNPMHQNAVNLLVRTLAEG